MSNGDFDLGNAQNRASSNAIDSGKQAINDLQDILPVTARVVQEFQVKNRRCVLVDKCVLECASGRVHLLEFAPDGFCEDLGMLTAQVAGKRIYLTEYFTACGMAAPEWTPSFPGKTYLPALCEQFQTLAALSFKTLGKVCRLQ